MEEVAKYIIVYVFFVLYIPIFLKGQSYILGVGPIFLGPNFS